MRKTIDYPFNDGTTKRMRMEIGHYVDNGNLYFGLRGIRGTDIIPFTVNVGKLGYLQSAIDGNTLDAIKIVDLLEENGLAWHTGLALSSGYCIDSYPVVEFNADALRQIDAKAFAEYREAQGFAPEKELGDLAKEAKERAAKKNATRSTRKHKQAPDLGL